MPQPRIFFGNSGGGGPGTIEVRENDVAIVGACTILNFIGSVSVANAGGGKANVTITGAGYDTVIFHTLTAGEIAAKQLNLPTAPAIPSLMLVDQVNGTPAIMIGIDFTVVGTLVDWNGLGMDGVVAAGDILRFAYAS